MHPEAAKLLESIEGELGVVTIAGPYRTGKSSLAGRALLDNPKAFQSAPTVNPCTKVSSSLDRLSFINSYLSSICKGSLDLREADNRL